MPAPLPEKSSALAETTAGILAFGLMFLIVAFIVLHFHQKRMVALTKKDYDSYKPTDSGSSQPDGDGRSPAGSGSSEGSTDQQIR